MSDETPEDPVLEAIEALAQSIRDGNRLIGELLESVRKQEAQNALTLNQQLDRIHQGLRDDNALMGDRMSQLLLVVSHGRTPQGMAVEATATPATPMEFLLNDFEKRLARLEAAAPMTDD